MHKGKILQQFENFKIYKNLYGNQPTVTGRQEFFS